MKQSAIFLPKRMVIQSVLLFERHVMFFSFGHGNYTSQALNVYLFCPPVFSGCRSRVRGHSSVPPGGGAVHLVLKRI